MFVCASLGDCPSISSKVKSLLILLFSLSVPACHPDIMEEGETPESENDADVTPTSTTTEPGATPGNVDAPQIDFPGLLAYWAFDENSGTTVSDSSGRANQSVLQNFSEDHWRSGKYESALYFDGDNDIRVVANDSLQPESVTMCAWIKLDFGVIQRGWIVGEGDNYGLAVNRYNPGELHFYFRNGRGWPSNTAEGLPLLDGNWHHVVGAFDHDSKKSRIYFDGELLNEKNHGDSIVYDVGEGVHIGSMLSRRHYKGLIDEVRIYDRALDPEEVEELAQR